jgi:hypothetical protein
LPSPASEGLSGRELKPDLQSVSGSSGAERAPHTRATESLDSALSVAITDLAGVVAELVAGPEPTRFEQLSHSADLLMSRLAIDKCQAAGWDLDVRAVASLAYSAVRSNWHSILRAGACLLAVNELSGSEIAALCGHTQGPNT